MHFIPDIPTLQSFVPVAADLDLAIIHSDLSRAVRRHIQPLLGREFLGELFADYKDSTLDEKQLELVDYINAAAAPLALWIHSKKGGVTFDSSGIYKRKNENRWNLSDTEQQKLEASYLSDGIDALDDLLNYLEDSLADFPTYADAPERKAERLSLIPSASVVLDVFHMLCPRITFCAMREGLRYMERTRVKPLLQDYYSTLIGTSPAEGSFDNTCLILARRAVIYLGTGRALVTRGVTLTTEGLRVMMDNKTQVSDSENARIEAAAREYLHSGEVEIATLVKLLNDNPPVGYTPPSLAILPARCKSLPNSKILLL